MTLIEALEDRAKTFEAVGKRAIAGVIYSCVRAMRDACEARPLRREWFGTGERQHPHWMLLFADSRPLLCFDVRAGGVDGEVDTLRWHNDEGDFAGLVGGWPVDKSGVPIGWGIVWGG